MYGLVIYLVTGCGLPLLFLMLGISSLVTEDRGTDTSAALV